jgi:hypothetical protein
MSIRSEIKKNGWIGLTGMGIVLVLVGFFSPWIDHPAAGLALTGFEMGEWIKFAPQVRDGSAGLNRAGFYWPAAGAATALAMIASVAERKGVRRALLVGATLLALLPLPLIEEMRSIDGIRANWGRFALIALGLLAIAAVLLRGRRLPSWGRGAWLVAMGVAGVVIVNGTFAGSEPIVEQLYNRLVDPGSGLLMVQIGQAGMAGGGIWQLVAR